jgi:hypothetical protein
MIDRERKVNVENMNYEQADLLQKQITAKLNQIIENALKEANKMLNIYGMEAKMAFKVTKQKKAKK